MTLKHPLTTSLLALAGLALLPRPASAQTQVTYSADDLLLALRTTGASTPAASDYLVDLGPASQFTGAAFGSETTLSLGNLQADLTGLFGANWFSRSDLFWSISGTSGPTAAGGDPLRTLYASKQELSPGLQSSPWLRANSSGQAAPTNRLASLGAEYAADAGNPNLSTANSSVAIIQPTADANSYASFQSGSSSFGYFTPTIEGDFSNGAGGTVLDLYRLAPGSGGGDYVGSFDIGSNGRISFNVGVVPEPNAAAILAMSAGVLGMIRRRRLPANA